MSDINVQVNDVSAIPSVSREIEIKEAALNNSIKELLLRKQELEARFSQLNCSLPDFSLLRSNAVNLSNIVELTSDIASQLSGKVRKLDVVKSRVMQCVAKLDSIIDLKSAASGASIAFQNGRYEEAAEYIQKYLNVESEIVNLAEKLLSDDLAQKSVSTLVEYQQKLRDITCKRFDEAVAANDQSALERFNKIFPQIGLHKDGLDKFSQHLCSLISKNGEGLRKLLQLSSSDCKAQSHFNLLSQIFEYNAKVLQDNQAFVKTAYGSGHLFHVVSRLQTECDRQVTLVLDRFRSRHDLSGLLNRVRSGATGPGSNPVSSSDAAAVVANRFQQTLAMEPIISEILHLTVLTQSYLRFIRRRVIADVSQLALEKSAEEKEVNEVLAFFNNCQMVRQMQELAGVYISLEQFYLREMVIKAAASDEVDSETYRFADDVFFVLKKCIDRSFSSGNVDSVCAVLNHACSVLLDHLVANPLAERIRAGFPAGKIQDAYNLMQASAAAGMASASAFSSISLAGLAGTSSSSTGTGLPTGHSSSTANLIGSANAAGQASATAGPAMTAVASARHQFLVAMNTLEACLANLMTLVGQLDQRILSMHGGDVETVGQSSRQNVNKLQACLDELKLSLSNRMQQLVDSGFDQLSNTVVKNNVKSLLNGLASFDYRLTEDQLDECTVNDPWIETCIINLESFTKPFRDVFSPGNSDRLIHVITSQLVSHLEQLIRQKKFSRFGAIQLEKELRCLSRHLTSISSTVLHNHFTRLFQLCNLLNLDKVEDVSLYWNTSSWRFTLQEVRAILISRVDFAPSTISSLKL